MAQGLQHRPWSDDHSIPRATLLDGRSPDDISNAESLFDVISQDFYIGLRFYRRDHDQDGSIERVVGARFKESMSSWLATGSPSIDKVHLLRRQALFVGVLTHQAYVLDRRASSRAELSECFEMAMTVFRYLQQCLGAMPGEPERTLDSGGVSGTLRAYAESLAKGLALGPAQIGFVDLTKLEMSLVHEFLSGVFVGNPSHDPVTSVVPRLVGIYRERLQSLMSANDVHDLTIATLKRFGLMLGLLTERSWRSDRDRLLAIGEEVPPLLAKHLEWARDVMGDSFRQARRDANPDQKIRRFRILGQPDESCPLCPTP